MDTVKYTYMQSQLTHVQCVCVCTCVSVYVCVRVRACVVHMPSKKHETFGM